MLRLVFGGRWRRREVLQVDIWCDVVELPSVRRALGPTDHPLLDFTMRLAFITNTESTITVSPPNTLLHIQVTHSRYNSKVRAHTTTIATPVRRPRNHIPQHGIHTSRHRLSHHNHSRQPPRPNHRLHILQRRPPNIPIRHPLRARLLDQELHLHPHNRLAPRRLTLRIPRLHPPQLSIRHIRQPTPHSPAMRRQRRLRLDTPRTRRPHVQPEETRRPERIVAESGWAETADCG